MEMEEIRQQLERHLRTTLSDESLVVGQTAAFGDGHSGFTYSTSVVRGGASSECVLRLSPPGARIAGPADVGRQGCLMESLSAEGVPVPPVIAYDSAPSVAGRAFMLVHRVEGCDWTGAVAESSHEHVARETVSVLQKLHAVTVPLAHKGLRDEPSLGPREELARWRPLLARAGSIVGPEADTLQSHLDGVAPAPTQPAVVHGDFHYGNLIFRDGRIVAILDWEIAAIGERLVDLGSLVVASLRTRYAPEPNSAGSIHISATEIVEMYGEEPENVPWFISLNCLKYAAIIAFNLGLHRSSRRIDPVYEELQGTIKGLIADGELILLDGLDADCLQPAV
jgi:aminoglycoside phosphotransferase (APT) family kinase protein